MALSVRTQALSLLLACALGGGLGLFYDLLRPIRRRGGSLFWDLLFCLTAAVLCFLFAMRAEYAGLGTGELMSSLLGLLLYFRLLSPFFLPIFENIIRILRAFFKKAQDVSKKVRSFAKKLFQNQQG